MGVLFVMPNWAAPSEVWMQRMIEALIQDISYLAVERPEEKVWRGQIPVINLTPPKTRFNRIIKRLGFRPIDHGKRLLIRAVQSEQVTCVFAHWLHFALRYMDVWNDTNKPLFVHCHGYDITWNLRSYDKVSSGNIFSDEYPNEVRRLSERAILIANSHCTAQKLKNIGVPPHRIAIHYFGVPSRELTKRFDRVTGITLLFLGRLVDFKGPDLLIKAFELACDRGFQGRLVMAGDGPLGAMCELMQIRSKYSKRIKLLGAVHAERAAELRREADIFTAHSCIGPISNQEEGFGVAFAEAMADGLPVVTGRAGALEELVVDGVTGILFTPGDVDAHADALLKLANNPELCLQMGKAAWQRARALFPLENDSINLRRILGLLPNKHDDEHEQYKKVYPAANHIGAASHAAKFRIRGSWAILPGMLTLLSTV